MRRADWLCIGVLAVLVACGGDVTVMMGNAGGGGEGATPATGSGPDTGQGAGPAQGPTGVTGQTSGQTTGSAGQGGTTGSSGQGGTATTAVTAGQGGSMTTGPTSGQGGSMTTSGQGGSMTTSGQGGSSSAQSSGQGGMSSAQSSGQGGIMTVTATTGAGGTSSAQSSGVGGMSASASSGTGGGPNCPHDPCMEGDHLDPACGMCEASVCQADPFCCQFFWDGLCVNEAEQFCGLDCPTCPHDVCSTGGFLDEECDPCAATVCAVDITCCTQQWDGGCIQLVGSLCNMQCP